MIDIANVWGYNKQKKGGEAVLKIREVAERLNVSEGTVRNYIADGYLKAVRLGGGKKPVLRVTEEALQEFIEKGASHGK